MQQDSKGEELFAHSAQSEENGTHELSTITGIEPQKRRSGRYSVYVDNEFFLGVDSDVLVALGLAVGQKVDRKLLDRIVTEETVRKAKAYAYNLLSYRQRTEKELRDKLASKGYNDAVIDTVVSDFVRSGLIDDKAFADAWMQWRTESKPAGKRLIKWELKRKGVAADVVDDTISRLQPEDERISALNAARRRLERLQYKEREAARESIIGFLRRRGFDWEVILDVINTLADEGCWSSIDPEQP
jgi:regulatory protein